MSRYIAPLADLRFALYDVLDVESIYRRLPGCEAATRDMIDAVLDEAAKFAEQILAPLNQSGDAEGCAFDAATHSVRTPKGFKDAFTQYVDGGWIGLTAREAFGGQGLPETVGAAFKEMIDAANLSWGNYPMLSHGASSALEYHGEDWQREVFLKHRPRPAQDPRAAGRRWQLPDQRHEDFHHRGRTRFRRQHFASGAGAIAGCTGRSQGHLAVHRAEVQGWQGRKGR